MCQVCKTLQEFYEGLKKNADSETEEPIANGMRLAHDIGTKLDELAVTYPDGIDVDHPILRVILSAYTPRERTEALIALRNTKLNLENVESVIVRAKEDMHDTDTTRVGDDDLVVDFSKRRAPHNDRNHHRN